MGDHNQALVGRDERGRLLPGHTGLKQPYNTQAKRDHDVLKHALFLAASEAGKIKAIRKAVAENERLEAEGKTALVSPTLYEGSGLVTYLIHQALEEPRSFMSLLGRAIPAPRAAEDGDDKRPIELTIRIGGADVISEE